MVQAEISRCLSDPLNAIKRVLESAGPSRNGLEVESVHELVERHFRSVFELGEDNGKKTAGNVPEIPILSPSSSPLHSLVRLRCMIQDPTPSPELFIFDSSSCDPRSGLGMYTEEGKDEVGHQVDEIGFDGSVNGLGVGKEKFGERTVMIAEDVPGESRWVKEAQDHTLPSELSSLSIEETSNPWLSSLTQRYILKFYNPTTLDILKSTTRVEVVGIYDKLVIGPGGDGGGRREERSSNQSSATTTTTTLPCIHVLFFITPPTPPLSFTQKPSDKLDLTYLRQELIDYIAQDGLDGDRMAAEFVLLACLGKVQARRPGLQPLGPFSLNLLLPPNPSSTTTADSQKTSPSPTTPPHPLLPTLSSILPLVSSIPLTLGYLNDKETRFAPKSVEAEEKEMLEERERRKEERRKRREEQETKDEKGDEQKNDMDEDEHDEATEGDNDSNDPRRNGSTSTSTMMDNWLLDGNGNRDDGTNTDPSISLGGLKKGVLQLPQGSKVLIDARGVETGIVNSGGLKNIQTLQKVIKEQKLPYHFPFSDFEFDTDLGFLVLSKEGMKSLIETDCVVPVVAHNTNKPSPSTSTTKGPIPSNEKLDQFRWYLDTMRQKTLTIPDEVSEAISMDFVRKRKEQGTKALTQDDLMLRMSLFRLLALSYGRTKLDMEMWNKTVELDVDRKRRLA